MEFHQTLISKCLKNYNMKEIEYVNKYIIWEITKLETCGSVRKTMFPNIECPWFESLMVNFISFNSLAISLIKYIEICVGFC